MIKHKKLLRISSLLATLALLIAFVPVIAPTASADVATSIIPGRYYYIRAKHSNLYLDANKDTGNVVQWDFNGGTNQQWQVVSSGANDSQGRQLYYLLNLYNDKVLDVSGGGTGNGTNIQVYTKNSTNSQKFVIAKNNDVDYPESNTFRIGSVLLAPGKVLDESTVSNTVGGNVHLWNWIDSANNQRWYFEEVERNSYNGKLSNGKSISYWIDPGCSYTSSIPQAANKLMYPSGLWNPLVLTPTTTKSNSKMDFYEYSDSDDSSNAYAQRYKAKTNGVENAATLGELDSIEWVYGKIYINDSKMKNYDSDLRSTIILHEMCHIYGGRDVYNTPYTIMYGKTSVVRGLTIDYNNVLIQKYNY